jgi:hypothetical protein
MWSGQATLQPACVENVLLVDVGISHVHWLLAPQDPIDVPSGAGLGHHRKSGDVDTAWADVIDTPGCDALWREEANTTYGVRPINSTA